MLNFLRAFIKRRTLVTIKNFFLSLLIPFTLIMPPPQPSDDPPPPPFDPSQPSVPLSYPIKTLEQLVSRSYFDSFHYPFNKATIPLMPPSSSASSCDDHDHDGGGDGGGWGLPKRPRLLVCHDMAGGYTDDDKWVQGGTNAGAYGIWHWYLMDVFVYFSHSLVTIPPPTWVNAAHKHGVKVLGTFITEWDGGRLISDELLSTEEYARICAERLTELAVALGFDGWLLLADKYGSQVKRSTNSEFERIRQPSDRYNAFRKAWYDSVTVDGELDWQDQLNDKNKAFFDLCDGIFINYTWKENYPKLSATVAGDRKFDVYMGIDVFGRNTFGGGQWNTNTALDVIRKDGVSAAVFAPGWVYETNQPPDFQTAQNRWWDLIEKSWGVVQKYPRTVPFYSNFDQGHGHHFSIDGKQLSSSDWCNLSRQSFQPFLEFKEDPGAGDIQVLVNTTEESYSGGGNVTFKGSFGSSIYFSERLFQAELLLGDSPLCFTYSVKSDGKSLVGLSLEFLSTNNENEVVLLASHGSTLLTMNKFSTKFSKVIMPHRVNKLSSENWVLQENTISMPGYTLTEIRAVCYKLEPGLGVEERNIGIDEEYKSEYNAVLGHLSIQSPALNVYFPPSSSWLVEGQSVSWEVGSGQSKSVSLKISWRLKDGCDLIKFQKYHIYVEKVSEAHGKLAVKHQGLQDFLGTSLVEAFYVSELLVPSDTLSLKFFIQVCGVDGTCQPLDDSPFLQLDIEG